jgi:hypothetical protein
MSLIAGARVLTMLAVLWDTAITLSYFLKLHVVNDLFHPEGKLTSEPWAMTMADSPGRKVLVIAVNHSGNFPVARSKAPFGAERSSLRKL